MKVTCCPRITTCSVSHGPPLAVIAALHSAMLIFGVQSAIFGLSGWVELEGGWVGGVEARRQRLFRSAWQHATTRENFKSIDRKLK